MSGQQVAREEAIREAVRREMRRERQAEAAMSHIRGYAIVGGIVLALFLVCFVLAIL